MAMSIRNNLLNILKEIPTGVKLVAVSKTKPIEAIEEAYACGQLCFGENKAQEIVPKYEALPKDIEWHFIGHLQTNKVKYIAPFIHTIHSIDSFKILKEVNKQALANSRQINVLLQMHIAKEETKFGFSEAEIIQLQKTGLLDGLNGVRIVGLMGMATNTDNDKVVTEEFSVLTRFFKRLKNEYFKENNYFTEVSMGMSSDYLIGIAQGSTMVRLGSSIFGHRNYQ